MLLNAAQGVHRYIGTACQLLLAEALLITGVSQQAAETLSSRTLSSVNFWSSHSIFILGF